MFLNRMTDQEKCSFLGLADAFVRCDDELSERETALIQCLADEAGVSKSEMTTSADPIDLARTFKTRSSRVCALLELIGLGHADSDYSTDESQFVQQLASEWGMSEAELAVLENWVLRLLAVMEEAQSLIEGED
jgi:uncharacterized tellurite resistance protein B-like protein